MNPVVKNRIILLGTLLVAGTGLSFIAFGNMGDNLVYYWSPSELLAQKENAYGPTIRLGGIVAKGSLQWNAEHTSVKFRVANDKTDNAPSVQVVCEQTPPQMFREGIGVVVEGTFSEAQVFKTQRLMVNHSNEYRPPSMDGGHNDWQKSVTDSTASRSETP